MEDDQQYGQLVLYFRKSIKVVNNIHLGLYFNNILGGKVTTEFQRYTALSLIAEIGQISKEEGV